MKRKPFPGKRQSRGKGRWKKMHQKISVSVSSNHHVPPSIFHHNNIKNELFIYFSRETTTLTTSIHQYYYYCNKRVNVNTCCTQTHHKQTKMRNCGCVCAFLYVSSQRISHESENQIKFHAFAIKLKN